MKSKLLLIIDPQIDFITGTLSVPEARQAMDSLADYVRFKGSDYARIIVTADRHPMRHCSFKSECGEWPSHCVEYSVGAAIWQPLMDELMSMPDKITILHKGENPNVEEYSILKNKRAAERILEIVETTGINRIDICGLAGDVCVADTIRDLNTMLGETDLNVLKEFSPSIDGGKTLDALISQLGLSCT